MKLTSVQISDYKCIRKACRFDVADITCLVGKNESGKTAVLEALYRLNPVIPDHGEFNVDDDYPRIDVEDYRLEVKEGSRESAIITQATFALEEEDLKEIREDFPGIVAQPELILSKGYTNELYAELTINEEVVVEALLKRTKVSQPLLKSLIRCSSLVELSEAAKAHEKEDAIARLLETIDPMLSKGLLQYLYEEYIEAKVPKFLYFDEFYQMQGHVNLQALVERKTTNQLQESDYPLLGLIDLARLNLEEISNPKRALERDNRLEGASNHLTRNIMKYWSQNRYLEMRFDIRPALREDPEGMQTGTNLWGHVYNSKQKVSTLLGRRSKGFIWFFSFLAWFSQQKRRKIPLILLLDEPSLFLHASAQKDLLRFLEDECADGLQVIYSTQSPYMVDAHHLDRVRIVEDRSTTTAEDSPGTQIYTDSNRASRESIQLLFGALAHELVDDLARKNHLLIVDSLPDLIYLQAMSALLREKNGEGLNRDWLIAPLGGLRNLPVIASLLEFNRTRIVAGLFESKTDDQVGSWDKHARDLLRQNHVYSYSDFTRVEGATIEDLFDQEFYLGLVNKAFSNELNKSLALRRIGGGNRGIVDLVKDHFTSISLVISIPMMRYKPALYFTANCTELATSISEETFSRFEKMFGILNTMLQGSQTS